MNNILAELRAAEGVRLIARSAYEIERLQRVNKKLVAAIESALADNESGEGWGPDVTVCGRLRAALDAAKGQK